MIHRFNEKLPKDNARILSFHPTLNMWISATYYNKFMNTFGMVIFDGNNGLPIEGTNSWNTNTVAPILNNSPVKYWMHLPKKIKE